MKILLVEDDEIIGETIKKQFEQDRHVIDWAKNGADGESAALNFKYDAIVMDISLPRKDGIAVIANLRSKQNYTPILILTANNSAEGCVQGLSVGADDYLAKPFEYIVLRERLSALVRRERRAFNDTITYRDLKLDARSRSVTLKNKVVDLTPHEYVLLELLISHHSKPVSHEKLIDTLYTWDVNISSNVLAVHIHNLRRHIGKQYIKTIRGVGYKIA